MTLLLTNLKRIVLLVLTVTFKLYQLLHCYIWSVNKLNEIMYNCNTNHCDRSNHLEFMWKWKHFSVALVSMIFNPISLCHSLPLPLTSPLCIVMDMGRKSTWKKILTSYWYNNNSKDTLEVLSVCECEVGLSIVISKVRDFEELLRQKFRRITVLNVWFYYS